MNPAIFILQIKLFSDDAIDRAVYFTNATIDALIWINYINCAFGNAVNWAVSFASSASDTGIENFSWHGNSS